MTSHVTSGFAVEAGNFFGSTPCQVGGGSVGRRADCVWERIVCGWVGWVGGLVTTGGLGGWFGDLVTTQGSLHHKQTPTNKLHDPLTFYIPHPTIPHSHSHTPPSS